MAIAGPDSVVRAVAQRIVDDETAHVRFHRHRLHAGFEDSPVPLRLPVSALVGDGDRRDGGGRPRSRRLLDAIGYRRTRFVRDVLTDFNGLAAAVLTRRGLRRGRHHPTSGSTRLTAVPGRTAHRRSGDSTPSTFPRPSAIRSPYAPSRWNTARR